MEILRGLYEKLFLYKYLSEINGIRGKEFNELIFVKDMKRRIRHLIKKENEAINLPQWKYRGLDSRYYKEWIDNPEEQHEKLIDAEWVHINNPRDCTGLWFTNSISFYRVGTRFLKYHFQNRDV